MVARGRCVKLRALTAVGDDPLERVRQDYGMTDPRTAIEYRIPATELRIGDLVNTSPGEGDWQQVTGVYLSRSDATDANLLALIESVSERYVVVQLTDVAPVDSGVYFADGVAMTFGADGTDEPVTEVVSTEDGVRTYLYTRFELVTVRASS